MSVALSGLAFWTLFGFSIAGLAGLLLLVALGRLQVRQHAYEDAPQTHRGKTGTPTMGGIVFVVVLIAALALARIPSLTDLVWLVVLCAAIGAIDDIIKVRHGANRGLPARTKLLATALAAVMFLRAIDAAWGQHVLLHAGTFWILAPHWLWFVLGVLAITGTIHAVNLTDGLDGLAAGTMIPPLAALALIAAAMQVPAAAIAAS
jgi:phospho-N-acetylmuramoyl-pentapeptide-transferase